MIPNNKGNINSIIQLTDCTFKNVYKIIFLKGGNGCLTGYYFHVRSDQAS